MFAAGAIALSAYADARSPLTLNAGVHLIQAEVAADLPKRTLGLMNRKTMPPNAGMLFVFSELDRHCMWMRNTLLPLSVAFMDEAGAIVSIHDMQPQSDDSHCAVSAARYALEMNQGWFAKRGIKPGNRIGGIDKAPPPQ